MDIDWTSIGQCAVDTISSLDRVTSWGDPAMFQSAMLCGLLVLIGQNNSPTASPINPVIDGAEGQLAFDELAVYYETGERPDFKPALRALSAADPAERVRAGRYLLALFRQSLADESNGRAEPEASIGWGGGSKSRAHDFREELAEEFADEASVEALDAALFLIENDESPENQKHGAKVLCRINSPRCKAIFKQLLAQPHPCGAVTVAVIKEVAYRELRELRPDVLRLTNHYRAAVRDAARDTAMILRFENIPEFNAAESFTPWLDSQVKQFAAMLHTNIPADARWIQILPMDEEEHRSRTRHPVPLRGWLLSEDPQSFRALDWFNRELTLRKSKMRFEDASLAETIKWLAQSRQIRDEKKANPDTFSEQEDLSPEGSLTGQFEPRSFNLPEALVGIWCYSRGEKRLAAEVLFPCFDRADDDRKIVRAFQDLIGRGYHLTMLDAFSRERNYDRTLALAIHLSKPVFDGYFYQHRAKELAEQLPKRRDDFGEFRLPTKAEWKALQSTLLRQEQIRYLAGRLRLINCFQMGQPGGVGYQCEQTSEPEDPEREQDIDIVELLRNGPREPEENPKSVINPFVELLEMHLEVAELPVLIPFLADDNFMPTYSFWRDFHPGRTLHRANWAVAEILNEAAHRELAMLDRFNALDSQGKQAHLESLISWCRDNAGKTRAQLVLQTLRDSRDWDEFEQLLNVAVERKLTAAHPVIAQRLGDFPNRDGDLVEACYALNTPEAASDARRWIESTDEMTRFWAALILVKHGDTSKGEGLDVLGEFLANDKEGYDFRHAVRPLLAAKTEPAARLAAAILPKLKFHPSSFGAEAILQRLFLAGRSECLDFLVEKLDSEEPHSTHHGAWNGEEVKRSIVLGDHIAAIVNGWRTDKSEFDSLAPDMMRRAGRTKAKVWLKEQFALIRAVKPHQIREPAAMSYRRWHIDAP
jgi:hypothetical protein